MRFWKSLLPLVASTLCFAAQSDRITGPIDSSQMVALQNHVSPLAQPRDERGLIDSSTPLRVTILFTPTAAQHSALQKLLADQQDPKSSNFHKWLTPEQYADRFGLSQHDIDTITAWLQSQGLKVTYVARGRDSISFSGDAGQVQIAFRTQIHRYEINGEMRFSNSTSPMIPAALSGIIGGFRGLHNFVPRRMSVPHNPNSALLHPDYTFSTIHGTFTVLAPGDIATIYDITPLYQATTPIDGTGQKLVIVGQTDIHLADLTYFRSDFGLPAISGCTANPSTNVITACDTTNFQFVIPTTAADPGVNAGDLGESDLDIEWSGSVARNAKIIFVTSDFNSGGVFNSISWAIDNDLAPVISISYGLCEAYATPPSLTSQDLEFQKGAMEGISIFAASGDGAAATCDAFFGDAVAKYGPSVSYPASSPEVTAVGGTEFDEGSGTYWGSTNGANGGSVLPNGPMNGYIPELAWNDTVAAGGPNGTGGGPSNCVNGTGTTMVQGFPFVICKAPPDGGFTKPAYQTALTPGDGVRDVPDISFSASNFNDPYIVCTAQSEIFGDPNSSTSTCVSGITPALTTYNSAFGGTSASTPVAAGMAALLNQYLGGNGLGNINTELYKLFGSNPSAFHDILAGTSTLTGDTSDNIVPCSGATPSFEPAALQCPAAMNTTGSFGFSAGPGYDLVTGLGSIDFNALFTAWAASSGAPDFTLAAGALSPSSIPAGQSTSVTLTIAPVNSSTQTINFTNSTSSNPQSCSAGLPAGALCSFNPTSVTLDGTNSQTVTLTISTAANMTLPSGAQTITVTGTASGAAGKSHTATVSLTVTATNQTFTLGDNNIATFPVTRGGTVPVNVTVTGTNGFIVSSGAGATTALQLTYSCTGSPSLATAEISCQISPGNGQPTNATAVTVSLVTTAPTALLRPPLGGSRIFYALLLPGLFGVVFFAGSRTRGLRLLSLIVVLAFSTLWLGSCGGGSSTNTNPKNPGTPTGTYTVTIGATTTGGANNFTNSNAPFTIQLVVN